MKIEEIFNNASEIKKTLRNFEKLTIANNSFILLDSLCEEFSDRNILILVDSQEEANNIKLILPQAILNPEFGLYPYEIDVVEHRVIQEKIKFLREFYKKGRKILISSIKGLFDPILPPDTLKELVLKVGEHHFLAKFAETLVSMGYRRASEITDIGEFSIKGNIIDIYTLQEESPVRVELNFEGVIEQIRLFDIETMRSYKNIDSVSIVPNSYYLMNKDEWRNFEKKIKSEVEKTTDEYVRDSILEDFREIKRSGNYGMNFYFKFIKNGGLLPFPTLIEETEDFLKIFRGTINIQAFLREAEEVHKRTYEAREIIPGTIKDFENADRQIEKGKLIRLEAISREDAIDLPVSAIPESFAFISNLEEFIRSTLKEKSVIIATEQFDRVKELLKIYNLHPEEGVSKDRGLYLIRRYFDRGVETDKALILTDREIFPHYEPQKGRSKVLSTRAIETAEELKDGDYVVHRDFGIGIFRGLVKLEENGTREYIHIEYRDGEKLYVPLERIGFVEKYIGDRTFVYLNKLTGNEWKSTREKVRENAKLLARRLLHIQAERKLKKGFSFKPFEREERILALSFPYELTYDQEKALEEVYRDMESIEPMDRLICGDVGYGKTEIAIRAAFRAVLNGKQVAVLVPTTILSMQHERTFSERLRLFPVEIATLSRLTPQAEEKKVIQKLKEGKVDILIGTHRILSEDVHFKDLGLLVVDEEQKFGVRHKEKIKELKSDIDVLTLTATPIPRTLHSAILNLKAVSLISTPPPGRIPVKTFVLPFNKDIMKNAIEFELHRGGQVYFVHNRIEDIFSFAKEVRALIPQGRVEVVHGRMSKEAIEKIMLSFYEGNIDVLVSTTIIENGLDIPTVNTLIVDKAENFGLTQMYQLRGRVGRSHINAFAYLFYTQDRDLKSIAEERLETIKEFSGEAAGLKIALKDLEIRGAGNLLGKEQHGHIVSVGYNMYITMLEEAVNELRGIKKVETVGIPVKLNETYYIPDNYISVNTERMDYYRRITTVKSMEELEDIRDELEDRFGSMPEEVDNLLLVGMINYLGRDIGVSEIFQEGRRVFLTILDENYITPHGIEMLAKSQESIRFGENYLSFEVKGSPLTQVIEVLNILKGVKSVSVD